MLVGLASALREPMGEIDFEVYARLLGGFSRELLEPALEHFAMAPRDPYKKTFPTTGDIAEKCREIAAQRKPKRNQYCGRCNYGVVRVGREWERCPCVCERCHNTGVELVGSGEGAEARVCGCRKARG